MKMTLLDLKTGKTAVADDPSLGTFQWSDNNWSCDCNRANYFNLSDEEEEQMDREAGGFCLGSKRFFVIAAECNGPDDYEIPLEQYNEGYPKPNSSGQFEIQSSVT